MQRNIPDFQTTFDSAVETIKKHPPFAPTSGERDILTEQNGSAPSLNVTVGQVAQPKTVGVWDDVDILKVDPSTIVSRFEQWDTIAGNKKAKMTLYDTVVMSRKWPQEFDGLDNILLFGPPGTGKTLMVECLAAMGGWNIFKVGLDSFKRKFQGESEMQVPSRPALA